jgi:Tol biopolymer transport system component
MSMRWPVATLLGVTACLVASSPANAVPGGRLLFDDSRLGENCGESCEDLPPPRVSIYSMRASGKAFRRLPSPCRDAGCVWGSPAASPDGRTIALPGLWLVDADGTDLRRVPGVGADVSDAAWSPGGSRLAFACFWRIENGGSQADICTVAPDGTRFRRLTTHGAGQPTWSPTGLIAFVSPLVYQGRPQLWTMPAGGGAARLVTDDFVSHPSFSPGGTRIAYECRGGICVVGADGRGRRRLARSGDSPAWSPNGRWIAYIGQRGIVRVRPDGSGRTLISRRSYPFANLAWTRTPN